MHQYKIYGLRISSSRPLELLGEQKSSAPADLTVNWEISTPQTPDNAFRWRRVHSEMLKLYTVITLWKAENKADSLTKVCLELADRKMLNFVVDTNKKKLWIYHHADVSGNDLESYFVGAALGIIMRLRGTVCLHSSVVEIDGKAIALTGYSTAGKSTTAAGLVEAGAKMLADDIAALESKNGGFIVHPGYSKVRLRPVAAEFLTSDPESLPIVYSDRDSRYVPLNENLDFSPKALPLAAIYVLGNVSDDYREPFIEPVEAREKLINLLGNTYGNYVVMNELRANEFKVLSGIARTIPMRRLHYAHDITTLPAQCRLILEDFRQLQQVRREITFYPAKEAL